jgi:NTE family protein
MFGAWQAGAWKAIAPCFEPELVVGASVGSLNGWAIAGGCSPDDLVGHWLDADGNHRKTIHRLTASWSPRIPYCAVVTDVLARRTVGFVSPRCDARVLAASCAVPPVFWPRRIDGRWCADGGFIDGTPVSHAVELGATQIVVLNAIAGWESPLRRRRIAAACNIPLVELVPETPFGGTLAMLRWNRPRVRKWLEAGERAGHRFVEQNKAFFETGGQVEAERPGVLS